jgi:two-component system chemotaxis response regulator CheY
MEKIFILCIDDQREVLSALSEDLSVFEDYFELEECESAVEALDVIENIDQEGDYLGLIISDHVMPDMTGVEFLSKVKAEGTFTVTKKILLTGLATHQDTIEAINAAEIDKYIEKPWDKESLIKSVKSLLTQFIVEKGIDYTDYIEITDSDTLYKYMKRTT